MPAARKPPRSVGFLFYSLTTTFTEPVNSCGTSHFGDIFFSKITLTMLMGIEQCLFVLVGLFLFEHDRWITFLTFDNKHLAWERILLFNVAVNFYENHIIIDLLLQTQFFSIIPQRTILSDKRPGLVQMVKIGSLKLLKVFTCFEKSNGGT